MTKTVVFSLVAFVALCAGFAALSSYHQSAAQAGQVEAERVQATELSEAFAQKTQEGARIEELRLSLRTMSELLSQQLADTYVERDDADRKAQELQAAIDTAIALDEARMKEVDAQVKAFTDRILALTKRINDAVEGSAEQERLINELAAMNAEVDKKVGEATIALDELATRQNNLRLTLNSLNEELSTEKSRAEKRERNAAALKNEVSDLTARVAVLKFNIQWYESRRSELQRMIAAKRAMARVRAQIKVFGLEVPLPHDLIPGAGSPGLPIIGVGEPPISIGGPGGGVRIGGHKLF
ncbi:MAG: hypothetical protein KDD69_04140 [Bdellovibrionales bacterium]|nr:hypothetical protein [Bdellovibrionales bacterium]